MERLSIVSKDDRNDTKFLSLQAVGIGSLAGIVVFPAALGSLQVFLFAPLRLSCSIPIASSVFGSLAVATSATIASITSLSASLIYQRFHSSLVEKKHNRSAIKLRYSFSSNDLGFYVAAAGITFKLIGGRFKSVLPSSFYRQGAFAHSFIPAKGQQYATTKEKLILNSIGRKHGCHTCGNRRSKYYVGDHIPPNSLQKQGEQQVFYPQCNNCSSSQGGLLAVNSLKKTKLKLRTHVFAIRLYHMYLPFPFILMAIRQYIIQ